MERVERVSLSVPWLSRISDPQFKPLFLTAIKGDISRMLSLLR